MDVDDAMASEELRTPRDGASVVAVGRARNRHGARDGRIFAIGQPAALDALDTGARRDRGRKQSEHRVSAAQGFKALEPEAIAFVLVGQRGDAKS
jgi:hypothetical protein